MESNYVTARDVSKEIVRLDKLRHDGHTHVDGVDLDALLAEHHRTLEQTGLAPK
jgi:hypothetical protein